MKISTRIYRLQVRRAISHSGQSSYWLLRECEPSVYRTAKTCDYLGMSVMSMLVMKVAYMIISGNV